MSIPQQVRDPQKHRNMLNYCTAINNRLTGKAAVGKRPTEKPQIFICLSIPQQVRDPQKHRNVLKYCTAISKRFTGKMHC